MTKVKICGLKDRKSLDSAVNAGADFIGFVFYPPSPRFITPEQASVLKQAIPSGVKAVGLFVDASNEEIETAAKILPLDMLQLHGSESAERIKDIKARFSLPVIKAIRIGGAQDLDSIQDYEECTDWLLFDARPENAILPGGTGQVFDWTLLSKKTFQRPWMLSGGLTAQNVSQALSCLQPDAVDVSSGVESAPGIKKPEKIRDFINTIKTNG